MVKNIDSRDMRQVIIDFPKQFLAPLTLSRPFDLTKQIKSIIVCGMGGSALPADILKIWLEERSPRFSLPLYIHRDYDVPNEADENTLIIYSSYSGNTEEPISGFTEAIKRNYIVAAISSNGKIKDICEKNNLPFVKIPAGIEPRCATGYLFLGLLKILKEAGLVKDPSAEIADLSKNLEAISQDALEAQGKALAEKSAKKIILIYASNKFKAIAKIWKIKLNENAKTPAFYNYFPELNHNEMNGFVNVGKNKMRIIILKDRSDRPRILKRMAVFSKMIEQRGAETEFVDIKEGNILFKVFSSLMLGDWFSYHLALRYKTDPTPVQMVEEFKKKMEY